MKRVYIATPMAGMPDLNAPVVFAVAENARRHGYDPVVPHLIEPYDHDGPCPEVDTYPGAAGGEHGGLCHLRADLIAMLGCDEVWLLPGWEKSRGATTERATALSVGIPVVYL